MKEGLLWTSGPFLSSRSEDASFYRNAEVCGVLKAEPKPLMSKDKQETIGVDLRIKYNTGCFMKVSVWRKSEQGEYSYSLLDLAQSFSHGDRIVIWGTIKVSPRKEILDNVFELRNKILRSGNFTMKDIEKDWWWELDAAYILPPVDDILFLRTLRFSPALNKLLQTDEPDAMESINDHTDEYEYGNGYAETEYVDNGYDYEIGI